MNLPDPSNGIEYAYFAQFRGDNFPEYPETRYTVFNYTLRFAVFESADYQEAFQVAQWECEGMNDKPEDRISAHTVMVNAEYADHGCFWLPGSQDMYQKRLDTLKP